MHPSAEENAVEPTLHLLDRRDIRHRKHHHRMFLERRHDGRHAVCEALLGLPRFAFKGVSPIPRSSIGEPDDPTRMVSCLPVAPYEAATVASIA